LVKNINNALLCPIEDQQGESLSDHLARLKAKCDSKLEKDVLDAIVKLKLPLPDEAQITCFIDGVPITKADFFYAPNKYIFVDGPKHAPENIREEDIIKRDKLESKGNIVIELDFIDGKYDEDPSLIEKEVKERFESL
ncbi:unnamed protein product, partial [marine sediment metagenome]